MGFFNKDVEAEGAEQSSAAVESQEAAQGQEANDLNDALATPETEFVAAQKKPLNQTAMMLFLIVLVGGAGTYFMYYRNGPQSATSKR